MEILPPLIARMDETAFALYNSKTSSTPVVRLLPRSNKIPYFLPRGRAVVVRLLGVGALSAVLVLARKPANNKIHFFEVLLL